MQIAFGNMSPVGAPGDMQTSGATMSFTHQPMDAWTTQRLDSPMGQRFLQAISSVTGLSQSNVTTQLQNGTTVHQVLESTGATFAQVRDAVRAQGGQVQFHGRHHHAAGAGDAVATAALNGLAEAFGMTPASLEQQLASGTSLDSIASSHGVSQSSLQSAVEQALESMLGYTPGGAQSGSPPTTGLQVDTNA